MIIIILRSFIISELLNIKNTLFFLNIFVTKMKILFSVFRLVVQLYNQFEEFPYKNENYSECLQNYIKSINKIRTF